MGIIVIHTGVLFLNQPNLSCPGPFFQAHLMRKGGIGEAELAWEDRKVAFMLDHQLEEGRVGFEKYGWTIVTLNDSIDVMVYKIRGQE